MPDLKLIEGTPQPRRRTVMDTRLLTIEEMNAWAKPKCQRRDDNENNAKIIEVAAELQANGGILAGVIHLGTLVGSPVVYLLDGQQRRVACNLSGLPEFIADVREIEFETEKDMACEFKILNTPLVKIKPDDLLRADELIYPLMAQLRERCPFIGYDNVRRSVTSSPMLSMSAALKCWFGSALETPATARKSEELAKTLTEREVDAMTVFFNTAFSAWGTDPEYYRLWANLNLLMCMWLYRNLVLSPDPKRRAIVIDAQMFRKCLMSVSADGNYIAWLLGRNMTERDRCPAFKRVKAIFAGRLSVEYNGKAILLPKPSWYNPTRR